MSDIGRFAGPLGFQKAGQSDAARLDNFLIKPTAVSGRELVTQEMKAGEATIDLAFPVWFVELPNVTFGGELEANEFIEDRRFPTVSMVVVAWVKKLDDRLGGGYFIGAQVAVVTTGKPGQKIWVHWRAEGKAMRNPSVDMGGAL